MRAEIIAVGNELLYGMIANTNAKFISEQLKKIGIETFMQTAVADNITDIKRQLSESLTRSNIIILTGGLGPTDDDLTKDAVCELLNLKLKIDEQSLDKIESYFFRKGESMADNNIRQAMIPEGSKIIKNDLGLSPGCILKSENQCIVLLPGPFNELKPMFENSVKPFLRNMTGSNVVSKTVNVFGMTESLIAQSLSDLIEKQSPTIATYFSDGETDIFVSAKSDDIKQAISEVDMAVEEIERRLGTAVYGVDEPSLHHAVVSELVSRKITVATAESCTGGLISKKITDISGSSFCFNLGITSYSEGAKNSVLGVLDETLKEYGAVSAETACQMAVGAMNCADSDMGIAVTGYAGPASSMGEPVGLVFISVCNRETVWVKRFNFFVTGNETREQIREMASLNAFDMVRKIIDGIAIFNSQSLAVSEIPNSQENKERISPKFLFNTGKKDDENAQNSIMQGDNSFKARFFRFAYAVLPNRNDIAIEKVRKSVFLTALVTFIVAICIILNFFMGINQNKNLYNKLSELKDQKPSISENYPKGYLEEFANLYNENDDIAGWVKIDGTNINYPVVKYEDNSFYLDHNFYGDKERHGTPFIDYRNNVKYLTFNTVVYGHNMKSDNQMFSDLTKYYDKQDGLNFYRQHPVITFDTVYEKMQWKIFAVFTANVDSKNGEVFPYYDMLTVNNKSEFNDFTTEIGKRSIINTAVDIRMSDKFLTLSTCYYEYDGQRLVVMARLVRDGETSEVDVNAATYNRGQNSINTTSKNTTSVSSSYSSTSSNSSRPSYKPQSSSSEEEEDYFIPSIPFSDTFPDTELDYPDNEGTSSKAAEEETVTSDSAAEEIVSDAANEEVSSKAAKEETPPDTENNPPVPNESQIATNE